MQLIFFVLPFVLYKVFQEQVADGNQKHPGAVPKLDSTAVIILVVTELLDFYQLLRTRGQDLVETVEMDKLGIFL